MHTGGEGYKFGISKSTGLNAAKFIVCEIGYDPVSFTAVYSNSKICLNESIILESIVVFPI